MFFRITPSRGREYLRVVANKRDGARAMQRVLAALGCVEEPEVDGELNALLRSDTRFSEIAIVNSSVKDLLAEALSECHRLFHHLSEVLFDITRSIVLQRRRSSLLLAQARPLIATLDPETSSYPHP